mmetsp:Transcript_15290/g.30656  ORF Transcript_15290/g.30656 Transcript_15290/m.30656 type:complete len:282 (+) Transcript_15290:1367-2212(+)
MRIRASLLFNQSGFSSCASTMYAIGDPRAMKCLGTIFGNNCDSGRCLAVSNSKRIAVPREWPTTVREETFQDGFAFLNVLTTSLIRAAAVSSMTLRQCGVKKKRASVTTSLLKSRTFKTEGKDARASLFFFASRLWCHCTGKHSTLVVAFTPLFSSSARSNDLAISRCIPIPSTTDGKRMSSLAKRLSPMPCTTRTRWHVGRSSMSSMSSCSPPQPRCKKVFPHSQPSFLKCTAISPPRTENVRAKSLNSRSISLGGGTTPFFPLSFEGCCAVTASSRRNL